MKIFFIIGSLEVGGAEGQLVMLARELKKNGDEPYVYSLEGEGPHSNSLKEAGVPVIYGRYRRHKSKIQKVYQLFASFVQLCECIGRHRPDVVHAYLPLTNLIGSLAASIMNTPKVISSRRALGLHQERYPAWKILDHIANRLSHQVTANSLAVKIDTVSRDGIAPEKITVITNGFVPQLVKKNTDQKNELLKEFEISEGTKVLTCVANLISYKGHEEIIRALARPNLSNLNIKVLFVGEDRGLGETLLGLARELAVEQKIVFAGRREDVTQILRLSDVFVLASHEEGFSNAVLEAMAEGLAIVATRVGGNPEALDGGKTGLLVASKSPEELSVALAALLNEKEFRSKLGELAKSRVLKTYSVETMLAAYLKLYKGEFLCVA